VSIATIHADVATLNLQFLMVARSAVLDQPITAALQFGLNSRQVEALRVADLNKLQSLAKNMGHMAFQPVFRSADLLNPPAGEMQLA